MERLNSPETFGNNSPEESPEGVFTRGVSTYDD